MVDNKGRRRTASFPGAFAFMALAITACGSTGPESSVAGSTVAATLHVCESCHGRDGRSISPTFPRLAGQQKNYIVEQLKAFRDKTRADPHARTYMWGLAAGLSDPTIGDHIAICLVVAILILGPRGRGGDHAEPDDGSGCEMSTDVVHHVSP